MWLAMLCMALLLARTSGGGFWARADMGNFSGNSDYGGSSSSSSSWSSSYDSDGDSDGEMSPEGAVAAIIIMIIIVIRQKRQVKNAPKKMEKKALKQAAVITSYDPAFNAEALKARVARDFVMMQQAWSTKQWAQVRYLFSSQLYHQFENQMKELTRDGLTNHVEVLKEPEVRIAGFRQDEVNDIIYFMIVARLNDYTVDADGNYVVGHQGRIVEMTYRWEYIRTRGVRTGAEQTEHPCPNCGAPVVMNASERCPYCGGVVESKNYTWVLNNVEGIRQRTIR